MKCGDVGQVAGRAWAGPWVWGRIWPLKPGEDGDDVSRGESQAGLGLQLQCSGQGEGRARLGQEVIWRRTGKEEDWREIGAGAVELGNGVEGLGLWSVRKVSQLRWYRPRVGV